ncbi:hypothetical protein IW644_08185 [Alteromonas sp. PRIM-21]|nr:hypothetical protein [Alteromonas sp. PRIM-21]
MNRKRRDTILKHGVLGVLVCASAIKYCHAL